MYMKALLCSLIIQLLGSHEVLLSDVPWDLQWQGETTFLDAETGRLGSISGRVIQKIRKWDPMPPRMALRVRGLINSKIVDLHRSPPPSETVMEVNSPFCNFP